MLSHDPAAGSPDEQDVAWGSSQGDDEGGDDRQAQEVGEDAVTAATVGAVAQNGCQVASLNTRPSGAYAPAVLKHLQRDIQYCIRNEIRKEQQIQLEMSTVYTANTCVCITQSTKKSHLRNNYNI